MNAREMTDKAREMGGKAQEWQKRAAEAAKDWGQTTDEYVHEHTWSTLAIAAVFGIVLGYVFASRRD
jgi:ElaB/YqjD/DUF883 family membrane-anchored ribosome-binding protein